MAVYQLTSPQGEKYQVTAPEGATQEQVMAYFHQNANGAAPKQATPGLVDSLKADYAARDKQIQDQVTATAEGKQTEGEMVTQNALSNASKLTDTAGELISRVPVVGPALQEATGAIGGAVKSIPLPDATGYDNVGQMLSSDTRLGRNLRAGGQALNLIGLPLGARGATAAIKAAPEAASKLAGSVTDNPSIATRAAAGEVSTAAPAAATTQADIGKMVGQNYDLAQHLNEKFTPDQVSDPFVNDINSRMPKPATANGVLSKDQQSLAAQLQETSDMVKGQPITLTGIDTVDKSLSAKIGEEVNSQGETTPNGRILKQLQMKLRATVANAPTDGTTALNNGRAAAAAQFALNDIDAAELRAQVQGGAANNYQAQYRRLFNDKDGIAGWPQAAKDALQKAATPSLVDKATGGVITHGAAISSAVLGHPLFGLAIEGGKLGADAAKTSFMKSRGAAVKQAIIEHAVGKIKDVNVPEPQYAPQAQLPAPGKAIMSNDEIAQMQAQLRAKPKTGGVPVTTADPSGIVAPVVPEAPTSVNNIADRLKGVAKPQPRPKGVGDALRTYLSDESGSVKSEDMLKASAAATKLLKKSTTSGYGATWVAFHQEASKIAGEGPSSGSAVEVHHAHQQRVRAISAEIEKQYEAKVPKDIQSNLKPTQPDYPNLPTGEGIVYHGGTDLATKKSGEPVYFTPDKYAADNYTGEVKGGKLQAAKLSINKAARDSVVIREAKKLGIDVGDLPTGLRTGEWAGMSVGALLDKKLFPEAPKLIARLKELGYDGAILTDGEMMSMGKDNLYDAHIVFDKSQIKPIKEKK